MADVHGRGDRWLEPDEMTVMPTVYTADIQRRVELIREKARRLMRMAEKLESLPRDKE